MLGTLLAAQAEVETQLAELRRAAGDPALIAQCGTQLGVLYALQGSLSAAPRGTLAGMRSQITTAVAAASTTAQEARLAVNASIAADSAQLAATSAATRQELASLNADLFEKRIFDPYLKFSSPEDEEAYRRREAEGRRYIDEQLARKTPEGDLNAAGGTVDRMLDAQAHGAGDSPDFLPRWNRLVETTRKQRNALRAEGRSTEEFDRNLNASVKRYLHSKGLSETEIEAKLAATADPLDAVKPYLKTEQEAMALSESVNKEAYTSLAKLPPITTSVALDASDDRPAVPESNTADLPGLNSAVAKLRAAGVATALPATDAGYDHGVNRSVSQSAPGGRTTT